MKDNPAFCVATMQNYLRGKVPDARGQLERERNIRSKAEALLRERLRHPVKRMLYRWVLKNCRQAIKNRENQRFCRTQAYSLVRAVFRALGRKWHGEHILDAEDAIFYLTMDEIWGYIEGGQKNLDLKKLTAERRREFDGYRKQEPPDHIETFDEIYTPAKIPETAAASADTHVLRGLGCCAGIVEREVRVVFEPDSKVQLNGQILVARQTDPGWVVLFPSISGLIVEKREHAFAFGDRSQGDGYSRGGRCQGCGRRIA